MCTREPAVYTRAAEKVAVEARREDLHTYNHTWEAEENRLLWQFHKGEKGIRDRSREAIVDRVRDVFWLKDASPAREQERDGSV